MYPVSANTQVLADALSNTNQRWKYISVVSCEY